MPDISGGSSHILRFVGRLVECRQPWTNHLFMFIGRIYKPITFFHDPSRRDKSWIAALFFCFFCLRCFLFILFCFFLHFPTHALLSASVCFFFGWPYKRKFQEPVVSHPSLRAEFSLKMLSLHFNHLLVELRVNIPP